MGDTWEIGGTKLGWSLLGQGIFALGKTESRKGEKPVAIHWLS
jgi:hypothetical protein